MQYAVRMYLLGGLRTYVSRFSYPMRWHGIALSNNFVILASSYNSCDVLYLCLVVYGRRACTTYQVSLSNGESARALDVVLHIDV